MVRWLEKNGYDVSYLSDVDVDTIAHPLENYHALLVVGHIEYWSKAMRDHLETAINNRVNLAVFGANSIYWQIRYEERSSDAQVIPERIITCYKDKIADPFYGKNNRLVTVRFRDDPLNRPEQLLLGSMYADWWGNNSHGIPE